MTLKSINVNRLAHETLIKKCGILQAKAEENSKEILEKQKQLKAAENKLEDRQNDIAQLCHTIDCLKDKVSEGAKLETINRELTAKCNEYVAKYK